VTETQAAQIELNKTAEDFKSLHKERQELVGQWEGAIEAMKRRDEAIQEAQDRLLDHKVPPPQGQR
jgi:coiled-coil domain-containing protein 39